MQLIPYEQVILFSLPAILMGLGAGHALGGQATVPAKTRVGVTIVVGALGGAVIALLVASFRGAETMFYLLSVLSCIAGSLFGMVINWAPEPPKIAHHVVFTPEDDEEFDREIEEALGGDSI
ncbi:MAG: hypothetical protein ACTSYX_00190 [Candidatus Thorarchaeota archaeon]